MKQNFRYSGKERLEPRLTQRNYLVLKYLANLLRENIAQLPSEKGLVILDCGCGNKPYFPFFENISSVYVGIDLWRSKYLDVVGDVEKLPFNNSSFDVILCTQVLEHASSPLALVDEIYRTLKPHGFLFLSTHGVWPVHAAPFDFWRWTDSGLKKMLERFSIVKIYECGGSVASLFQIVNLYVPRIAYVSSLVSLFLNKMGEYFDNVFRNKVSTKLIVNYLAVARK